MHEVAIDNINIGTSHKKHPAFVVIIISGGRPRYLNVGRIFAEEANTVGVRVRVCNGHARGSIKVETDAIVIEGALIDSA